MKLKNFGHLKRNQYGLGKIILDGKVDGKKESGRPEKAMGKGHMRYFFDMSLIEVGRFAIDRNRFCYAVKDATPYAHNLQFVREIVKTFLQQQLIKLRHKITVQG